SDTLYCLAVMQHHGAPTRLLDCTYSPFVAAAFAMQEGFADRNPTVWGFNTHWLFTSAKKATKPLNLVEMRRDDRNRTDTTFIPLYQIRPLPKKAQVPKKKFVKLENPFYLNERLTTQQGVFICPADLSAGLVDNLQAMPGSDMKKNIVKVHLKL